MITLKTKVKIKDSTVNRQRLVNERFTITQERLEEMQKALGNQFNTYFEVIIVEKKKRTKKNEKQ